MKKSRKEFIKEAHNHACSEWKQKIEKEFPKLFKTTELKVNKWYKAPKYGSSLFNVVSIESEHSFTAYGFDYKGQWKCLKEDFGSNGYGCIQATEKEVEIALIKEAKRRGVWNVPIIDVCGEVQKEPNDFFDAELQVGALWSKYGKIFENGKWATIIETIAKEEAEKQLGKTII